jgi:ribosomal protein L3 glutamine methyltransferase
MVKLSTCIEEAASRLDQAGLVFGHGTDNAWDEAAWLVLHAIGLPVNEEADLEKEIDSSQIDAINELVEQRIKTRKPAAYLTGTAWFAGLPFHIEEGIIVPRSHIGSFLADEGKPWVKPSSIKRVLDLCTGSGCIAVAAALCFPDARVDATDIDPAALALAGKNVAEYDLQNRVRLIHSDIYQNIEASYDLILTNPPYVPLQDVNAFPPEFRHEPRHAFEGGADGLQLVHLILRDAASHLNEGGILVGEVGASWVALQQAYPQVAFTWLETGVEDSGLFVIDKQELMQHFG